MLNELFNKHIRQFNQQSACLIQTPLNFGVICSMSFVLLSIRRTLRRFAKPNKPLRKNRYDSSWDLQITTAITYHHLFAAIATPFSGLTRKQLRERMRWENSEKKRLLCLCIKVLCGDRYRDCLITCSTHGRFNLCTAVQCCLDIRARTIT